jgi:hypothetical protein
MTSPRTPGWRVIAGGVLVSAACVALRIAAGGLVPPVHAANGRAAVEVRDLGGRVLRPFAPAGAAQVIVFVQSDCPISNGYAPEIQRVCREYAARGVTCSLMYEDVEIGRPGSLDAAARRHLQEFGYGGIPAAVDRTRIVASQAGATITPQAVVVDRAGAIRYSGRIDNFYAALGRPRQRVTEHDLRDALDALLAGRPVPRPRTEALGCHIVDPAILER